VASLFAGLGVPIIDTDEIARDLTRPGSPALGEISAAFGDELFNEAGELDRWQLRQLVFADAQQRKRLEAILHPRIRSETLVRAEQIRAPYLMFAVPLLFESGFDQIVDRCLVVDCPESRQIERLRRRDGADESEARAMLAAQMSREQRLSKADDVIDNSGDIESLRPQVAALHQRYLDLAKNCSESRSRAE
jgi:dephospho-CoA kinase